MSNWYQQAALAFSDALTIKLCKVMPGMCRYGMTTFPNFVKIYSFWGPIPHLYTAESWHGWRKIPVGSQAKFHLYT